MKGLLNIILLFVSALSFGQTYGDTIYVNYGINTSTDTGVYWNTIWNGTTPIYNGTYSVNNYSNYFSYSGTIQGLPAHVGGRYMYMSGGTISYIRSTISGIQENWAHVYLGMGSSNVNYNTNNYIYINGEFAASINPYNNTDVIYIGAYQVLNGAIQIRIESDTTFACLNSVEIHTVDSTAPKYPYYSKPHLAVPNPIPEADSIYQLFRQLYGDSIFSGWTGSGSDNQTRAFWRLNDSIGFVSKLWNTDLRYYSPNYPYRWSNAIDDHIFGQLDLGYIDSAINRWNNGNIICAQIHMDAPSCSHGPNDTTGYYGEKAGFDHIRDYQTQYRLQDAINPDSVQYDWFLETLDSIASKIKILRDLGIPLLWRPFHEADGGWFWWGRDLDSATWKAAWGIMFDRFTNYHGLNNLIWVMGNSYPSKRWYVDPSQIDIIGLDHYPGAYNYTVPASNINIMRELGGDSIMVALTETGPIPNIIDFFNLDKIPLFFIGWSTESLIRDNTMVHLEEVYSDSRTITYTTVLNGESGGSAPPSSPDSVTYIDTTYINFNNGVDIADWEDINYSTLSQTLSNNYEYTRIYSASSTISSGFIPGPYPDAVCQNGWYKSALAQGMRFIIKVTDTTHYFKIEMLLSRDLTAERLNRVKVTANSIETTKDIDVNDNTELLTFYAVKVGTDSLITFNIDTLNGAPFSYINAMVITEYDSSATYCQSAVPITIDYSSIVDTLINGVSQAQGSIDITVSNGVSPYVYLWGDGPATEDRLNLSTGYYNVTVTDDSLCTADQEIFVGYYDSTSCPTITISSIVVNSPNGSINIEVSGGAAPYGYLWSNGAITQDIDNLESGVYSVVVTDDNGCIKNGNWTITSSGNNKTMLKIDGLILKDDLGRIITF